MFMNSSAGISIPLSSRENFYCEGFSHELNAAYQTVISGLLQGKLRIDVRLAGDGETIANSVRLISEAIDFGCPEAFFVDKKTTYATNPSLGTTTIVFSTKYPLGQVTRFWNELDRRIQDGVRYASAYGDDYAKICAVNEFLCLNIKGDANLSGHGDAYGALVKGSARCEGIAKAAELILERLGFRVILAHGKATMGDAGEDHAWTIVYCNGTPYHFDFSWNCSRTAYGIPCVAYLFLCDRDLFVDHEPHTQYPVCDDDSLTYWVKNRTVVQYGSDFSQLKIEPFKNNYYALAKLEMQLGKRELDERMGDWFYGEMAGGTYCRTYTYQFIEPLNLILFYMINDG